MRPHARPCISDKPRRPGSEPGVQLTMQGIAGQPEKARSCHMRNGRADPTFQEHLGAERPQVKECNKMPVWNDRARSRTVVRVRRPVNGL
ncbi:hypothetical protein Hdeb2414_s0006g00205391 [Helianthus debilis subsp. tardiflorus]